jgi:hypothetical protein
MFKSIDIRQDLGHSLIETHRDWITHFYFLIQELCQGLVFHQRDPAGQANSRIFWAISPAPLATTSGARILGRY